MTAVLAAAAATLWSLVTRQREHRRLHELLRIYVRYALGSITLTYGLIKVFPSQFPANDPPRLMEPYGNFSPQGVLWAFMAVSAPYTVIAGLSETVGAGLLFFRRTTTVGALLLLAVLGNIVLLNFCYDVPVKQLSLHLWLMALFLAVPDLGLIYDVLVRRRPVQPTPVYRAPPAWRWRIAARVGKALLISFLVASKVRPTWNDYYEYGPGRLATQIEGICEVDEISGDGPHWSRIGIGARRAAVASTEVPYSVYGIKYDEQRMRLTLRQPAHQFSFAFQLADRIHLLPDGPFRVRLHRIDPKQIPLTSHGFHWVQEYGQNR